MNDDVGERAYLSDYFEEVSIAEAMERPAGTKIWITGLVVSVSDSTIVLADPTGQLHVHAETTKSVDAQPESIVRILGKLGNEGHVEAELIVHMNIRLQEFVQMRKLEKEQASVDDRV
ncbi:MAG: hypothetical protein ACE5OZ_05940 [Candidatus Heimdallarchaeota archaeon]